MTEHWRRANPPARRVLLRSFRPGTFFRRLYLHGLIKYGETHPCQYYVLKDRQLVYLSIPKVACTSIKATMAKAYDIPVYPLGDLHSRPEWYILSGKLSQPYKGYHKFTFVRDPFDRLVSLYRSKFGMLSTPEFHTRTFGGYFFSLPRSLGFTEFVDRICDIPDCISESHFKSQHSMLYHRGKLMVDSVGRFERLQHDWQRIAGEYGFDPDIEHLNSSRTRQDGFSDYRLYYTKDLALKVYARYRNDVQAFGYQEVYETLLESVP